MTTANRFNPFDGMGLSQEDILAGIELLEASMRTKRKPSAEARTAPAEKRRRSPHLLTLKKCA